LGAGSVFSRLHNLAMLKEELSAVIRDVPDFPKQGILFKDITPVFLHAALCDKIAEEFAVHYRGKIDSICAIESRGFLFGTLIANKLAIPFHLVRKKGKLPGETVCYSYDLEYGSATVEIHRGFIKPGERVLVHDDILATGGTAMAAAELVQMEGGVVTGFAFMIELEFLKGKERLEAYSSDIFSILGF
jgi:adenine phosphoribosyltransferase